MGRDASDEESDPPGAGTVDIAGSATGVRTIVLSLVDVLAGVVSVLEPDVLVLTLILAPAIALSSMLAAARAILTNIVLLGGAAGRIPAPVLARVGARTTLIGFAPGCGALNMLCVGCVSNGRVIADPLGDALGEGDTDVDADGTSSVEYDLLPNDG